MIELSADECQVWWAEVDATSEHLIDLLDDGERDRWAQLRHGPARAGYAFAHALARLVAARLLDVEPTAVRFTATCRYCAGAHGRPRVDHPGERVNLSISHSGERSVVAFARDVDIGVDVERIAMRGPRLPVSALAASERPLLEGLPEEQRLPAFIRYWTRKEATLKATGDGLLVSPRRLTVTGPDEPPELLDWVDRPPPDVAVFLTDLNPREGYRASLASLGRRLTVVEHDGTQLVRATTAAALD
jgi:4'-phosphopantetheinyl transferase